jgi:hypothetical protein
MPLELLERLSVLEANYTSMDRRSVEHEQNDIERFDRSFKLISDTKSEILTAIEHLSVKVGELWDNKNVKDGAAQNRATTWSSFLALAGMLIEGVVLILHK